MRLCSSHRLYGPASGTVEGKVSTFHLFAVDFVFLLSCHCSTSCRFDHLCSCFVSLGCSFLSLCTHFFHLFAVSLLPLFVYFCILCGHLTNFGTAISYRGFGPLPPRTVPAGPLSINHDKDKTTTYCCFPPQLESEVIHLDKQKKKQDLNSSFDCQHPTACFLQILVPCDL